MDKVTNEQAAKLLIQDVQLLQQTLQKVVENSHFPGISHQDIVSSMQYISGKVVEKPELIDEKYLQGLVLVLARMAHHSSILLNDALIPGDLIEEAYAAKMMCSHVKDKWISEEDVKQ
jgi:hypothetical protein